MTVQPKLRFKGFTDDWEKRQLGDVVSKIKSYSLSRDVECNEETGYKYIHYGDIHTGKAAVIDRNSNIPNIKLGQYETLSVNDLVIADASEDYKGIASPSVVQALPAKHLVAGLHTIALRPQGSNAMFLYYLLQTDTFKHFGYKTGTGLKVFGISWPNLAKFEFNLPSLEGQNKIVTLIQSVDQLITVNQRKVDLLKKKKSAYLQKLFPKTGSNIPELRFKGYTDAWEKRKLKSLSKITYGGGTPNTNVDEFWGGNIPWIQSSNLINDDVQNVKFEKFISNKGLKNSAAKLIPENSITIVTRVGVGKLALIKQPFTTSQDFISLTDLNVSPQFGLYIIYNLLKKEINHIQGTSIKGITKTDLLSKKLFISVDTEEQEKIGNIFQLLDKLITVNQRKVDLLKKKKKALLQQMFI